MGVPKFYRWISERYPCLSTVVREYQIPEFDNLYLDMNGIIHACSHPNDEDPHFRITEEKIFSDIFNYLEFLFRMIKPRKTFFMAVDGVAPRAKMNQQRGRRFRSAREAELLEKQAIERGETLPTEARFDSNCISPGTEFMARLNEQLKYFVSMKISTDPSWQGVDVYLSGHETPGEGEHKVMDFIRTERSKPDYDPNTRHCVYGLDADLIMLGTCCHEPHFALLREEVVFGKKQNQRRLNVPEEITFHLLHICLLREYLDLEFRAVREKIPFKYSLEHIIDDWVLMCFLVGNDFLPHLPHLHIAKNALPMVYKTYMDVLPSLDGYINEQGTLNLQRFEKFLHKLAEIDYETFSDVQADKKFLESKRAALEQNGELNCEDAADPKKERDPDEKRLLEKFAHLDIPDFESDEEDLFEMEFRQHKRDYYVNKLDYPQVTPEVLQEQAHGYVRAIQWNLHYYYHGVQSWNWFYPHHYSPYISDIKDFDSINMEFEMGKPFLPFQQLMSIMPSASKKLLPTAYQSLMDNEDSPVIDYYPKEFSTDLNGKQQAWEAVVLIPFIDEARLLPAIEERDNCLTEEERHRNVHSGHMLFTYSNEPLGSYKSPLPESFPDVKCNRARMQELDKDAFHIPKEKIKQGLLDGINYEIYFPGFPTFKHIEHTASLVNAGVKVFQAMSRNENMLLSIIQKGEKATDKLAADLLGKEVLIDWPHLLEAKVVSIVSAGERHSLGPKGDKSCNKLSEKEADIFKMEANAIVEKYHCRFGIEVGGVDVLVYCKPMLGRRYICGLKGRITLEKQWAHHPVPYALQTVVRDISSHESHVHQFKTLEEVFPVGKQCFMIGYPHYGCLGEVVDVKSPKKQGRIVIKLTIPAEPDLDRIKHNERNLSTLHFMSAHQLGQQLGVNALFVSRITGTVFIQMNSPEADTASLVNVGLNLKFNKSNEEVPGYSKKASEGWLYSNKCCDSLRDYLERFTEFIEKIQSHMDRDKIYIEDIYPGGRGKDLVREVAKWIKEQAFAQVPRMKCGSELLDEGVVKAIEKTVDQTHQEASRTVVLDILPKSLFHSGMQMGNLRPDPSTSYRLYDRVVNVREGITVPLGLRGTVTGISKGGDDGYVLYNIVFDEKFLGGLTISCSPGRGYRMSEASLVNLSYGARTYRGQQQLYEVPAKRDAAFTFARPPRQPPPTHQWDRHPVTEGPVRQDFTQHQSPKMNKFHHSPNSPFELQKPPPAVEKKANTSDFASLWMGLQQASSRVQEQPAPVLPAPSAHLGVPVSVDELFRGAEQAKKTSDLSAPVGSDAVAQLAQYVQEQSGCEPVYTYTAQAHKKVQAVITLPNGKKFFSLVSKDKKAAAQDAAQQALNILKKAPRQTKSSFSVPTSVPSQRPYMPPPFSSHCTPVLGPAPGSLHMTRMPPRPAAALIPESFVESNQQLVQDLENSMALEQSRRVLWQTPRVPPSFVQPGLVTQDQARVPFYWLPQPPELLSPSYFTQTAGTRSDSYGAQNRNAASGGYPAVGAVQSPRLQNFGRRDTNTQQEGARQQPRTWRKKPTDQPSQHCPSNQFVPMQVLRNQPTTPKSNMTMGSSKLQQAEESQTKGSSALRGSKLLYQNAPQNVEAAAETERKGTLVEVPKKELRKANNKSNGATTHLSSVAGKNERSDNRGARAKSQKSRLAVNFNCQPPC